jgi:hypothetical protein
MPINPNKIDVPCLRCSEINKSFPALSKIQMRIDSEQA